MHMLLSAWPALALLLPALMLVSALALLVKGNRRALTQLLALLACFVVGAMLMEFFTFMGALMARSGAARTTPDLGAGTQQLLQIMGDPRSLTAPPLSLAAVAAYSVVAGYVVLLAIWAGQLRGKKSPPARKKPAKGTRKAAHDY